MQNQTFFVTICESQAYFRIYLGSVSNPQEVKRADYSIPDRSWNRPRKWDNGIYGLFDLCEPEIIALWFAKKSQNQFSMRKLKYKLKAGTLKVIATSCYSLSKFIYTHRIKRSISQIYSLILWNFLLLLLMCD